MGAAAATAAEKEPTPEPSFSDAVSAAVSAAVADREPPQVPVRLPTGGIPVTTTAPEPHDNGTRATDGVALVGHRFRHLYLRHRSQRPGGVRECLWCSRAFRCGCTALYGRRGSHA